jgi:hypothetical protein
VAVLQGKLLVDVELGLQQRLLVAAVQVLLVVVVGTV